VLCWAPAWSVGRGRGGGYGPGHDLGMGIVGGGWTRFDGSEWFRRGRGGPSERVSMSVGFLEEVIMCLKGFVYFCTLRDAFVKVCGLP
jgi:hypothetical protein